MVYNATGRKSNRSTLQGANTIDILGHTMARHPDELHTTPRIATATKVFNFMWKFLNYGARWWCRNCGSIDSLRKRGWTSCYEERRKYKLTPIRNTATTSENKLSTTWQFDRLHVAVMGTRTRPDSVEIVNKEVRGRCAPSWPPRRTSTTS